MLKRHLYLTGYRGTGKSSVGRWLATKLQWPCTDLDDCIEATAGKTIREIFTAIGESGFRNLEAAELHTLASQNQPQIIALGGGTILRDANRSLIEQSGDCVWLDADVETLTNRLQVDPATIARRPSLTNLPSREEIEALMAVRRPLYQACSQWRIDVANRTIDQVGEMILALLQRHDD